jgi:hypothetical protein
MTAPAKTDGDTRIAPDPFSAVLPALSALGAIASIAAVNWVAQEQTPDRTKTKRKAGMALRELERSCLGLQEIFRRFHKSPKLFAGEGGTVASPLKFGVHGVRVSPEAVRLYQQLINDIASMLVLATQNAFDVMAAIEDGEIDVPEELFFGFAEQQERLNKLIQQRATLKLSVETGYSVAVQLTKLVGTIRSPKVD